MTIDENPNIRDSDLAEEGAKSRSEKNGQTSENGAGSETSLALVDSEKAIAGEPEEKKQSEFIAKTKYYWEKEKDWVYTGAVFIVSTLPLLIWLSPFLIIPVAVIFTVGSILVTTPWSLRKITFDYGDKLPVGIEEIVDEMAAKAGIKPPTIKGIATPEINTLAYRGLRNNNLILTVGVVKAFDDGDIGEEEMTALIAHSISYLKLRHHIKQTFVLSWINILHSAGTKLRAFAAEVYREGQKEDNRYHYVTEYVPVGNGQVIEEKRLQKGDGMPYKIAAGIAWVVAVAMLLWSKFAKLFALHLFRVQIYEADKLAASISTHQGLSRVLTYIDNFNDTIDEDGVSVMPYPDRWQSQPVRRTMIDKLWDAHPSTESRVRRLDEQEALALEEA